MQVNERPCEAPVRVFPAHPRRGVLAITVGRYRGRPSSVRERVVVSAAVHVVGVGRVPFTAPGASDSAVALGAQALRLALADAGLDGRAVQQVVAGCVDGGPLAGQRVLDEVGMTGIPIRHVSSRCATGSTALYLARQAVASGAVECALAVGFEPMKPGAAGLLVDYRSKPFDRVDLAASI